MAKSIPLCIQNGIPNVPLTKHIKLRFITIMITESIPFLPCASIEQESQEEQETKG